MMRNTSISAGLAVFPLLSEALGDRVTKVYPVVADNPQLPYVYYAVTGLRQNPTKAGYPGADEAEVTVTCCTAEYADGAEIAEIVREALDCVSFRADGLTMRGCRLTDYNEAWADDAFIRNLIFTIKI